MSDVHPNSPVFVENKNRFYQPTPVAAPAYRCATQPCNISAIRVGSHYSISRYAAGSTVRYYFDLDTFEKSKEGKRALRHFKRAISAWNRVPVKFTRVYNQRDAFFLVVASNYNRGVYAEAFFPNDAAEPRVVTVYPRVFRDRKAMFNVFCHELGHVLGLRHEYAGERERQHPSVRLGNPNPQSVMNKFANLFDMMVQEEDIEEAIDFYSRDTIEGNPVEVVETDT
ncbi:hypothetical protein TWF696_005461 [Orbilia brochopaga]|uniref:Peptidase metallopeptidase domain-containing protein n=1 Tax=Orbilia brochopaga TaxID=3140254 RepID=A0AAV9V2I6_9PEZI